ncbi:MAG: tetratricopeptide repeat protein [Desulfovibrionaceae bacterium]|nr:tetratricopeptide repeat protein [Desulfovibrionaceae bacterium]
MREHEDVPAAEASDLTRQDLIDFEHTLKDALLGHVRFSSYSLFFPKSSAGPDQAPLEARFDPDTGELTLPLVLSGRHLATFLARGARLKAPRTLPRYLQALAAASLEKLCLAKKCVTDRLTGLRTGESFIRRLGREIGGVQDALAAGQGRSVDAELPSFNGQFGLILMDLDRFQSINENYGYLVGDDILSEVGRLIGLVCPRHVCAARLGNDNFAVLVPEAKPRACFQLAEVIREGVAKLSFEDEVSGDRIRITASLGYVNYPQGLSGPQHGREAREQARMLLRKAKKAVATAKDLGRNLVFAYADILAKGGKLLEVLPMQRLCVGLGRSVGAQEGQRYLVWSPKYQRAAEARITEDERLVGRYPTMYKGEIVLIDVQEEMSFAELLNEADPAWPVESGDRLTMVPDREAFLAAEAGQAPAASRDMITGLYGYRDFISMWSAQRQGPERFSLILFRLLEHPRERAGNFDRYMDAQARQVAGLAAEVLGPGAVGGRFGLNGLIYYLPERDPEEVGRFTREIVERSGRDLRIGLAAGAASYPCLTFGRADVLDNCRKALDHALLLPPPQAAAFDSVSLNIAADRRYMEGDIYGALEEFKLALLADADNVLARNSLGICLAQLGRLEQARRHFEQVVELSPDNVMALYNLGWTCQRMGDTEQARRAYESCLSRDPDHVFSLVRLGNLAERAGDPDQAEQRYLEAASLPGGEALTMRHLARLAVEAGDKEKAREHLHLALKANHNDAMAMHLLARLYLDSGEDPQIAEVLARQSSALAPDRREYWDLLARALRAQGKEDEALRAEARAVPA